MALRGVRVLELAGLAPVPFCAMVLADFGAEVIRIDKAYSDEIDTKLGRGKKSVAFDLKRPAARDLVIRLAAKSDILIEPFRAGVMEKLGLGPQPLLKANPRLIYARLTGYGQTGPLSTHAGHDINFLSYSGLLWALGSPEGHPKFPINLMGDFAGGGLLCSFAIASALFQRSITGKGQVIDLSMTKGAAYVGSWLWRSRYTMPFVWPNPDKPGANVLDGGPAFYSTYKTKDSGFVAVGALEPRFYQELLKALEVDDPDSFDQTGDQEKLREKFQSVFAKHDLKHWAEVAEKNPNTCLSPVLSFSQVLEHQHAKETKAFVKQPESFGDGHEPAPEPFEMSAYAQQPGDKAVTSPPDPLCGQHTRSVLSSLLGLTSKEINQLIADNVIECTGEDVTAASLKDFVNFMGCCVSSPKPGIRPSSTGAPPPYPVQQNSDAQQYMPPAAMPPNAYAPQPYYSGYAAPPVVMAAQPPTTVVVGGGYPMYGPGYGYGGAGFMEGALIGGALGMGIGRCGSFGSLSLNSIGSFGSFG